MAESTTNDQAAGDGTGGERQVVLRQLYVKDLSFEAPHTPGIFEDQSAEPEIKLNLRTSHRNLGEGMTEVVLHIDVHALVGERTAFLLEMEQAGRFRISGFGPDETRVAIAVACPEMLFPYAREAVSSIIQRGGFSQVLLLPVDFATLYAQSRRAPRGAETS